VRERAEKYLKQMLRPEAEFREGQWEAVESVVVKRKRTLVVQRTGWGKSIVYFIATRLLRDGGSGPTIIISPLLSLMRNQLDMASRIGIHAVSINSTNEDEWGPIEDMLRDGKCDVLLVSPERLANQRFLERVLPSIEGNVGLFVVDEAHCISDWGHDFRPDYRRIVRIVKSLPANVPIIATTATANYRVVEDVDEQLGPNLYISRGPLARESLRLQAIHLSDQAYRLAWLAQNLPAMPGSGIIYCLTVADCRRVTEWLSAHGFNVLDYHAQLDNAEREERERMLLANEVKALVATVALGMGYDKPDLGFVVHFQRPGNIISYYQQIGRAGRALEQAYAILLNGREDDEIQEYFINSAFPGAREMGQVVEAVEYADDGVSARELTSRLNLTYGRIEKCLKLLEVDGVVSKTGYRYFRTANPWVADTARAERVTAMRNRELKKMREFVFTDECLMEYISRELDDPHASPCGKCANCSGPFFSQGVEEGLVREAVTFLRRDSRPILPRMQWPTGGAGHWSGNIPEELRCEEGRALCIYADAGWGRQVASGKYEAGDFSDQLVAAAAEMILERWKPFPFPQWVTAVPSLRRPGLVAGFAQRLAGSLGLPFKPVLVKLKKTEEQKRMQNSYQQANNIAQAFAVEGDVPGGPVLLVDDMVDSRWTMTVCAALLLEAGSGPVFPFALAQTFTGGGS
jgi:ATP-dependent DNA helicase RecQ